MTIMVEDIKKMEHQSKSETPEEKNTNLKNLLEDTISTGKIGSLTIDPAYLVFERVQGNSHINNSCVILVYI